MDASRATVTEFPLKTFSGRKVASPLNLIREPVALTLHILERAEPEARTEPEVTWETPRTALFLTAVSGMKMLRG